MNSSMKNFWDSKKVKVALTSMAISIISIVCWHFGVPDSLVQSLIISINALASAYVIGQSYVDSKNNNNNTVGGGSDAENKQ